MRSERSPFGEFAARIESGTPAAREPFLRGMTLTFAFSYDAALVEFRRAVEIDPTFAMAWWGIALVNGPHINFPVVPPDRAKAAWEALEKARAHSSGASERERALIAALGKRYVKHQGQDRTRLDRAYADAMRQTWAKYPDDPDIGVLFADSMMDLRPWDLWKAGGIPQPGTEEILKTLETVMKLAPNHPGANHLYIHAVEGSNEPERAVPAADRLGSLVPISGHLVHMPAHIYARTGRWADAEQANVAAVAADQNFNALYPRPGFYGVYMAHNRHFLAFARMMRGDSQGALKVAEEMVAKFPPEFIAQFGPVADGFFAFVPEVLMRFGKWEEILATKPPPPEFPLAQTMWRFTRAVAFTALNRKDDALAERRHFQSAARKIPKDSTFGNNPSRQIAALAARVLDGEMAVAGGEMGKGIRLLQEAAKMEDALRYDEPPDWIQPVRHTLGQALLRAERYAEAEQVYREDLARFPNNGWSLFGLSRALDLQGKKGPAEQTLKEFHEAWSAADTQITSTCLCQPGV